MQQSYPSRNEVYTYKIYLKNRSPHLEPSYLPFLSYSVGSLNEQKGEAQRSGKEKKRSSYTPVHDSPYRNTHVMKQTGPGHSGSSVLRSNSLSGDPARDHSPPRVPAAGRCHTCRRSECLPGSWSQHATPSTAVNRTCFWSLPSKRETDLPLELYTVTNFSVQGKTSQLGSSIKN